MKLYLMNNYVEPDGTVGELMQLATEHGFDGVELRLAEATPGVAMREAAPHLMPVIWNGGVDLMVADAAQRERSIAGLIDQLPTLAAGGATVVNLMAGTLADDAQPNTAWERHGSAIATEAHWAAAVNGLQAIADAARGHGLTLSLEIHGRTLHDTAASSAKLAEAVGRANVGITFEPGNLAQHARGESIDDALALIRPRLTHVHLKNLMFLRGGAGNRICGLEEGDVNIRHCLVALRRIGYDRGVSLESTHKGDRRWMLRGDAAYLHHVVASTRRAAVAAPVSV